MLDFQVVYKITSRTRYYTLISLGYIYMTNLMLMVPKGMTETTPNSIYKITND